MYYGQFGEDEFLEYYFTEKYGENYIGNCIDIGASDGINGSNSYLFEQQGWDCICIEANPEYAESASKIRKQVFNYGISDVNKKDAVFIVYTINGGNQSAISSLGVDDRLVRDHKHMIDRVDSIKIEAITLDSLLESLNYNKKIDFVSIDTEGTEISVLRGFDLLKWKPEILVIENNYKDAIINEYVSQHNYEKILIDLGVNQFYKYKG